MEVICGINAVFEAIRAGKRRVRKVYVAETRRGAVSKVVDAATKAGVRVETIPKEGLFELARMDTHQGVAAETEPFQYTTTEELLLLTAKSGRPPFIVVLDQVTDPQNLGSIIRTAHLAGAHGLVIPKDNAAQVGPAATKAASGAVEYLPIAKVTNLTSSINILKNNNVWVVGADGEATKNIFDYDFTTGCAVVLGGEGRGLRRLTREHCDELLSIPMFGRVGSYNVSVAGAMFMTEVMRQRGSKGER